MPNAKLKTEAVERVKKFIIAALEEHWDRHGGQDMIEEIMVDVYGYDIGEDPTGSVMDDVETQVYREVVYRAMLSVTKGIRKSGWF